MTVNENRMANVMFVLNFDSGTTCEYESLLNLQQKEQFCYLCQLILN